MRFMKAQDGTAFNVDQIVSVGPAGPYLMVTLSNGRTVGPRYHDTENVWPADRLDEFLAQIEPRISL